MKVHSPKKQPNQSKKKSTIAPWELSPQANHLRNTSPNKKVFTLPMQTLFKGFLFLLVLVLVLALCGGCTPPKESLDKPRQQTKGTTKHSAAPGDPLLVFDPPITLSTVYRYQGHAPSDKESPWLEKYRQHGIHLKVEWGAPEEEYREKLNTSIASENLPDVFTAVGAQQIGTLREGGMLADLSTYLEDYASPRLTQQLQSPAAQSALQSLYHEERLGFLPARLDDPLATMELLYLRKDWLDHLELSLPTTPEEVRDIAIAFAQDDPDGNHKKDTYGYAINGQDVLKSINLLMTGYGIFPAAGADGMLFYSYDKEGRVGWDGEREEMYQGLQLLQEMYQQGGLAPDFITYDTLRLRQDIANGTVGMLSGGIETPHWLLQESHENNPNADWYAMPMPTATGDASFIAGFQPLSVALAVSAQCQHPQAVIALWNITLDTYEEYREKYFPFSLESDSSSIEDLVFLDDPAAEQREYQQLAKGIMEKNHQQLASHLRQSYYKTLAYSETQDVDYWADWRCYFPAPGHSYYQVFLDQADTPVRQNLYQALPSPKIANNLLALNIISNEALAQSIMENDASAWTEMLDTWNNLAGQEICQDVVAQIQS